MMATIDDLAFIYPEQLLIEFKSEAREKAWQQTQNQGYSNASARWNAYLNRLCLNLFLSYLETELERQEKPAILPSLDSLPSIWESVNGGAIQLGQTRLVLIPSEQSYKSEFRVPREWLEIPHWAGNYYLAVEVNLEENYLQIWGYTTHEQLRQGTCDRADETHSIDAEDLIEDLNVMWVSQELFPSQQPQVKSLPSLTAVEATNLIEQLQQSTPYSPRLEVSFSQWAALLANDLFRKKLYQRRLQTAETPHKKAINPVQWLQSSFEAGWQSIEAFLNNNSENLAYGFRQGQRIKEVRQVAVEGIKLIDLGVQLGDRSVALLVGLTQEENGKVGIRVQLYPAGGQTYLPHKIQLALLSNSEDLLQESEARIQDNMIQLKRFTCPVGTSFKIKIALDDFSIAEDFQINQIK
jgi:Protein of unknown function (DUF1822)